VMAMLLLLISPMISLCILAEAGAIAALGSASARIVDASGTLAGAGLVEVSLTGGNASTYGTVCGMSFASADVLCRQLGFDFGSVSSTPCSLYGGSNVCGAPGSPVSLKNLNCAGKEMSVGDCNFEAADAGCADHALDSVVHCGMMNISPFADGAVRLVDGSGAPALARGSQTSGRLEVYLAVSRTWAPVSKEGFRTGAAAVACKWMGFSGQAGFEACKGIECGSTPPHLSELACSGSEANLLKCEHAALEEVFCAPEESVILACSGRGDAIGGPAHSDAAKLIT